MSLEWRETRQGSWWGYSGELIVAIVGERDDGRWHWMITGVNVRRLCATDGDTASAAASRRQADKQWQAWLAYAGLMPRLGRRD